MGFKAVTKCLMFNLLGHSSSGMDLTDGALKSAQTYSLN